MKNNHPEIFYELAPIGYFDLDESTRIVKVNLTGAKLLDIPRSFLFGKKFSSFVSKNTQPLFYTNIQQAVISKIKQTCELELLKKDGSFFYSHIESVVIMNSVKEKLHLRLTVTNIHESRVREHALRTSEEKFRSLIETTKEWIWAVDIAGRFIYSNPSIVNILGYSLDDILNRNRITLIHKDDRTIATQVFALAIKEKRGWTESCLRWRSNEGKYYYLESNAVPFFNHNGSLLGFRGSDRDITARKHSESRVIQQKEALNKLSKENSLIEFASTLAHELAQPLAAVNNFITGSICRLHNYHDIELITALQKAIQEIKRIDRIICRMRDFAKYGKLYLEECNINELISEAICLIHREFPDTNVQIIFELKSSRPWASVDKLQIEQVIVNLLRNAIEALLNDRISNPKVQIICENFSNQYIFVSICDNGPGLKVNSDIDKIFEACFTTKRKGLGMGLAISKTIIEAHQGSLKAYRNHNQGLCLRFILPTKPNDDLGQVNRIKPDRG